ncbi:MAG TPA: MarC family protein [Stellaceae bacterium]|nr:MarC family protein [Stellaceae bacterium]
MLSRLVENLVTLIVVLDPVGSVPIFLHATARLEPRDRLKVAVTGCAVALLVLMLFLYFAQYLLDEMHIGIPAFRIAGGAVLLVFALRMIFGGHHEGGQTETARTATEIAVFPVALPGIAGPGALLAVVLLTDNNIYSLAEETVTAGLTVVVMVLVLAMLLLATKIQRLLGAAGIMVVTQIMGLILAAFSVQQMLDGFVAVFGGAAAPH